MGSCLDCGFLETKNTEAAKVPIKDEDDVHPFYMIIQFRLIFGIEITYIARKAILHFRKELFIALHIYS